MQSFVALLKRFHSDERGIFAVIFGVMAIVLVALAGAAVDYTAMETARTRAQIALDSAALGLAPTIYDDDATEETLTAQAQALVRERLANDPTVTVNVTDAVIDPDNATLRFIGDVTVPMAFVQLVGIPSLTATIVSEATKGSINIEVAVALDNTGSMSGDIEFLRTGLNGIIDILVSEQQLPTYSKMALAPYADGVNVGDYADAIRGTPVAGVVGPVNWAEKIVDITNATKTNPIVVTTATAHNYQVGDIIYINGVTGMTQLNNKWYRVGAKTNNTISLQTTSGTNINGTSGYSTFTGGSTNNNDKVRKCITSDCDMVFQAENHGFRTGDYVQMADYNSGATSNMNNKTVQVTRINSNSFKLDGYTASTVTNSNTRIADPQMGGGKAYCTNFGCEFYRFTRRNRSDTYTYRITKCATERRTNTYTEDPPSTTLLNPNYRNSSTGDCDMPQAITPLTSNREVLHAQADAMDTYGSTAGHLGTAWAWYMLSPEFGYVWDDAESVPSEYGADNTMKVAIIMTDGAYNLEYCNGVSESTINCDAVASSTTQAREICANMLDAGIVMYSVGFRISSRSSQATTLGQCVSEPGNLFLPADGEELVQDFRKIAQKINDLRLSL